MRFLNAEFIGYIGFQNGMNLNRVYIDFTKGHNNIVLISGMNGSGKSTLLSHLNIFPDPSTSFTPGVDASKSFTILDNDIIYTIQLLSAADNNGGRKTTKAFIQKNGVELNTNGNISSYKDIVYSEFELDTNYMTLSHLSNDGNKGLGSLTPAERKKFTSNIMENLEVYNEMYKTLNKKSSIYKAYISNLHSKIQNIGSKDYIESTIRQLREKEHNISVKIMELNNTIISIQAKCTVDDEEAHEIEDLNVEYDRLNSRLSELVNSVNTWYNKIKISPEKIEDQYENDQKLLQEYKTNLALSNNEWINLSNSLEETTKSRQSIEAEYILYQDDTNIENQYKISKEKLNNLCLELDSYSIEGDQNLIQPLSLLLKFFKDIINYIDSFYLDITADDLKYICFNYNPNASIEYQNELQQLFKDINNIESDIRDIRDKVNKVAILSNRPKKCNINDCPFIKEAIDLDKQYGSKKLTDNFVNLQRQLKEASDKVTDINKLIELTRIRDSKYSIFERIISLIKENQQLVTTFKVDIFDYDKFLNLLSNQYSFNEIRDPQNYINLLNTLISYDSEYKSFEKISIQYSNYLDKQKLMESNNKLLENLKKKEADLLSKSIKAKNDYDTYQDLVTSFASKVLDEEFYVEDYHKKIDIDNQIKDIKTKLDSYAEKAGKSVALLSQIKQYRDEIDQLTTGSKPITDEISKLSGQLTLLEEYYNDYNQYKSQYDMIETLKKYCSPTNGGIQVLFMQLYMNKTLELSNHILSMLFNGDYKLLEFIINQNEFRIPFVGNGLPVDDISNGSSSQVCMMSMIINLVLLHQASTKFNIARLDEIDDSLDTYNRSNFVNVLYKILPLLNIEQLFIISHSIELDSSFADIIKLKSYDEYDSTTNNNIIWDFKEEISK